MLGLDQNQSQRHFLDLAERPASFQQLRTVSSGADQQINGNYIETQIDYKTEDELNGILCSKLQLNDEGCFTIVEQTTVVTSSVSIVFFVLLVVSLVLVGAAVVYCYRKKLKRDMNK